MEIYTEPPFDNIQKIEVKQIKKSPFSAETRPTLIKWNGQTMVRPHSIRATVREILEVSKSLDVVHVNIIGNPSTGKTTLAKTIGHLIHTMSEKTEGVPYAVRMFTKKDLLDFENTLKRLEAANWVLIFDDLSFLKASATSKQIETVKQSMTEIRHLQGGKDVKIITIKISHYTLALDKYLRQNDFSYFTSVGSSEMENMEKIVGSRKMGLVHNFKKLFTIAINKKKFTYFLGKSKTFTYGYKLPFAPALFWNNDTLRNVVFPAREWIQKYCDVCGRSTGNENVKNIVDVKKFSEESQEAYGDSIFKLAVKNKLLKQGINVHNSNVVSAEKYIDNAISTGKVTLDEIASYLELKPNKKFGRPKKGINFKEPVLEELVLPETDTPLPPSNPPSEAILNNTNDINQNDGESVEKL